MAGQWEKQMCQLRDLEQSGPELKRRRAEPAGIGKAMSLASPGGEAQESTNLPGSSSSLATALTILIKG